MEKKTASASMQGILELFDMQTAFFAKAITGISKEDMHNRLNTQANHMAWLTGSLVQQRLMMTRETSPGMTQTAGVLFENFKGIQDDVTYPSNEEYLKDWEKISPVARQALVDIDDAKLATEMDMGDMKMTYYELITFTIYREASMIGQLALWRRLLGYPALKYD